MNEPGNRVEIGIGGHILRYRAPIGLFLIAVTIWMGYWAAHVKIATRFENFFPSNHPDTLLYRQFHIHYGGAQTLAVMLRVKHGDIFNYSTLQKIQDITRKVNILPGQTTTRFFRWLHTASHSPKHSPAPLLRPATCIRGFRRIGRSWRN
jgi:predicted RND superfamily exporter protein